MMTKRTSTHLFLLSLLAILFIFGCSNKTPTGVLNESEPDTNLMLAKNGNMQKVSGHVEIIVFDIHEKYSFNAIMHNDGTVSGEWQVRDPNYQGTNIVAHGNVTKFRIDSDGKTAYLGGVVERNNWGLPTGSEACWTVIDNGEGRNAPPDMATDLAFGLPLGSIEAHLLNGDGANTVPLTLIRGNVQVK